VGIVGLFIVFAAFIIADVGWTRVRAQEERCASLVTNMLRCTTTAPSSVALKSDRLRPGAEYFARTQRALIPGVQTIGNSALRLATLIRYRTPPRTFIASETQSLRGIAVLELALLAPWLLFLFVGILDWGFLSVSLISLENGTRVAALYTSGSTITASDSSSACRLVLGELRSVPNIGSNVTNCTAGPIVVTANAVTGPDSGAASKVTATYTTMRLVPIPGLLSSQVTLTRSVTMRIRP
jgi:Flp pilus assembly protein TadG